MFRRQLSSTRSFFPGKMASRPNSPLTVPRLLSGGNSSANSSHHNTPVHSPLSISMRSPSYPPPNSINGNGYSSQSLSNGNGSDGGSSGNPVMSYVTPASAASNGGVVGKPPGYGGISSQISMAIFRGNNRFTLYSSVMVNT